MSRFALFTFNPHPSDTKEFVQVMQSLLQPILQKMPQYIFVREKKGSPEEHIHLLYTGDNIKDKDKIKQKIENKSIKSFISTQIKTSNTDYKHAFDYLLIPQSQPDHMYYVGYVCKETDCIPNTKGFSQEYITKCVEYYHTVKRNQTSKIDNSWKHLKPNELHCYMEHYSKKLDIPLDNPRLILEMKANKISFNQCTSRNINITKQELIVAHKDEVGEFSYKVSEADIMKSIHEDDWTYWKALAVQREERIEKYKEEVAELERQLKKLKKGV